ncbi:MAG: hypothetical protein WC867_02555 [Candidatus Pacearchaeota archaeon]|jgi:hypothetical protein
MKLIKKRVNKKAQLTIFIILALLIAVVMILLFSNKNNFSTFFSKKSPINDIEKCFRDSSKEALELINKQGGSINPENYYLYQDQKIDYICYTGEYYKQCIMQKPLLKQSIQKEIKNYLEPKINTCVETMTQSLEEDGYIVTFKKPDVNIEMFSDELIINTYLDLVITKDGTESYKNLKISLDTQLYNFIMTASSIANWEARYGDSETLNYMFYYPQMKVEKKTRSDGTRIYILTDRESQEKFNFATRSVALPSGITGK